MITGYRPSYTKLFSTPPKNPNWRMTYYTRVFVLAQHKSPPTHMRKENLGEKKRERKNKYQYEYSSKSIKRGLEEDLVTRFSALADKIWPGDHDEG